jgi:competence protein ComEC
MKERKGFIFLLFCFLFLANLLVWIAVWDLSKPELLEIIFFNVGQGDSIFIETPKKHQILIDGGPDSIILRKLSENLPFWDRTIDLIILTHPENDHLGGLIEVLKKYKVEAVLWTGIKRNSPQFREWEKLIENERAKIYIAQFGEKIIAGKTILEIFYPFENLAGQEVKNSNDSSIFTKLIFEENSFLFTGDASQEIEKKLLEKEIDLNSDVLKVGHHGSKTSSNEEFLKKVSPEIAIISVGKENSYGHPHFEVLERLKKAGIKIFRTDLDGDIKINSDGKHLLIKK